MWLTTYIFIKSPNLTIQDFRAEIQELKAITKGKQEWSNTWAEFRGETGESCLLILTEIKYTYHVLSKIKILKIKIRKYC